MHCCSAPSTPSRHVFNHQTHHRGQSSAALSQAELWLELVTDNLSAAERELSAAGVETGLRHTSARESPLKLQCGGPLAGQKGVAAGIRANRGRLRRRRSRWKRIRIDSPRCSPTCSATRLSTHPREAGSGAPVSPLKFTSVSLTCSPSCRRNGRTRGWELDSR